jgi:hypothetical protein
MERVSSPSDASVDQTEARNALALGTPFDHCGNVAERIGRRIAISTKTG